MLSPPRCRVRRPVRRKNDRMLPIIVQSCASGVSQCEDTSQSSSTATLAFVLVVGACVLLVILWVRRMRHP